MGHGIIGKDIVPFRSRLPIYEADGCDSDDLSVLFEHESYLDDIEEDERQTTADLSDPEHPVLNGWTLTDICNFGKKNKLFGPKWSKGDFHVYLLNESDASNVGFYEISLCANDEASAREFLKDFANLFEESMTFDQDEIAVQWG